MKMNHLHRTAAALSLLATFAAAPAYAVFSFDLDTPNAAISGYTGPYATVAVSLIDATNATITFTSLTNSGNIYLMAGTGAVAVNVNATSWTLGTISGSNAGTGFTPGPYSDGGAGNEDGFGSFNQNITSFDGYTHSSDFITFGLTNTSGTWASDTDVLTANASGYLAAAHIFVTSSPADAGNGALATGYATAVPETDAWGMMLVGLGLVGLQLRRRMKGVHRIRA